ncbi:Di-copper centre-containing protein, partial [Hyaloscypha variabilis F]
RTTLLPKERQAYTDAVNCLMSKPSRIFTTDPSIAPGARSRFDDFTAVHINNTLTIHATANFLSWHRLFTWTYEQALKEECGYAGAQPYWNWAITALDPVNSPVFDGSPYSMGGNGAYEAHNCTNAIASTATPPLNCIPPGAGGGCVETGPFKNHTVNFAPVAPSLIEPGLNGSLPFLSYDPRCLKRDVSVWVSSNWTKDVDIADLINQNPDIYWFQTIMQGNGFIDGFFGVHAAGHYTIGGDPGGDFFASPGDPAFFLHHAQIDRTWWIWQNQDLADRQNAISGTITLNNDPPSRNGTLEDWLEMGILGTGTEIKNVMFSTGGPLCYIYV